MIKRYTGFVTINNILKKHGFTGFFQSPDTGKLCYISTDITYSADTVLIRSAASERDYTGGHNLYCSDETELVKLAREITA